MVFTIVTIIFLPMSFIASFFAINFEDWGDRLTMGYASKYMFGIGLAISFLFVASAFLMPDISDAWKEVTSRAGWTQTTRLLRKIPFNKNNTIRQRGGDRGAGVETGDAGLVPPTWPSHGDDEDHTNGYHLGRTHNHHHLEKSPGSKGNASTTAYCSWADDDAGRKRRELDGPVDAYVRMSRERDRYEQHARLGMSPIRYGARQLSFGSGHAPGHGAAWAARPSFDGQARRERFSGDLERGRARDLSRSRIHWEAAR